MKKILVTGGNGYIGSRLCLYLANQGCNVTPLCYPEAPTDEVWISKMDKIVVGNIRDEVLLMKLAEYKYDVVVHLVSLDHRQSEESPTFVASVNITPVWSLLNIFSKKGLQKFIYFSTVQVYGKLPIEAITEQYEPRPLNAYGLTHLIGEQICKFYNSTTTVKCRIVRLSNSYGAPIFVENNCWWLVVNDLCRQAYFEKKIVLQSDGTPLRDFIHGWDVCQAVKRIIDTDSVDPLYQISSGETLTIWDIACLVQDRYMKKYNQIIPVLRKSNSLVEVENRYYIDNSLLLSIGFKPEWTLECGIDDLFNFLERSNGKS